ncbi:MAG: hypothetical protein ACKOAD_05955 [Gammaproteobacteria bacterium]
MKFKLTSDLSTGSSDSDYYNRTLEFEESSDQTLVDTNGLRIIKIKLNQTDLYHRLGFIFNYSEHTEKFLNLPEILKIVNFSLTDYFLGFTKDISDGSDLKNNEISLYQVQNLNADQLNGFFRDFLIKTMGLDDEVTSQIIGFFKPRAISEEERQFYTLLDQIKDSTGLNIFYKYLLLEAKKLIGRLEKEDHAMFDPEVTGDYVMKLIDVCKKHGSEEQLLEAYKILPEKNIYNNFKIQIEIGDLILKLRKDENHLLEAAKHYLIGGQEGVVKLYQMIASNAGLELHQLFKQNSENKINGRCKSDSLDNKNNVQAIFGAVLEMTIALSGEYKKLKDKFLNPSASALPGFTLAYSASVERRKLEFLESELLKIQSLKSGKDSEESKEEKEILEKIKVLKQKI